MPSCITPPIGTVSGEPQAGPTPPAVCARLLGIAKAGQRLGEIHISYEDADEYRIKKIETPGKPLDWRVEKMKLSKDKTQLVYNGF